MDSDQWTTAARDRYRQAAGAALEQLRAHVDLVLARTGDPAEDEPYFGSADGTGRALTALTEAEFDWAGSFPFALEGYEDDDLDDAELEAPDPDGDRDDDVDGLDGEGLDGEEPGQALVVEYRARLLVRDEPALLAAGRAAYLAGWPEDTEQDAADTVTDAAGALELLVMQGLVTVRSSDHLHEAWGELSIGSTQAPGEQAQSS